MNDMLKFHGCLLHMAVVKRNNIRQYWTENGNYATKLLNMSRDKFLMIYGALRLYNSDTARIIGASVPSQKEKYDPLFKCRPIWNTTMLSFQKARNPGRVFSLDESMAKYRVKHKDTNAGNGKHKYNATLQGRCPWIQVIMRKPDPQGTSCVQINV